MKHKMETAATENVIPPSPPDGAASPIQSRTTGNKSKTLSNKTMTWQTPTSPSQSTSPSPTVSSRPQFTIPTLPEYPSTGSTNEFEFNGASSTDDSTSNSQAVLLGIHALEKQQEELERKRQHLMQRNIARANPFETRTPTSVGGSRPQDHAGVPMTVHVTDNSVDEITMASDLKGVRVQPAPNVKKPARSRINSIGKMLKTPLKPIKRSISDRFNIDPTPTRTVDVEPEIEPLICGVLHKLGRNNKWQKRWFESDGTSLKYFKSKNKGKPLAKLDLHRVGSIAIHLSDSSDCTFTIEVAGRKYYLCADTKEKAMDWVISLNRHKEAGMNIGGLKLMDPDFDTRVGKRTKLRSVSDSDEEGDVHALMVMNAKHSRARTKKMGKDDFSDMDKSIEEAEANAGPVSLMLSNTQSPSAGSKSLGSSSPQHQSLNANAVNAFLNPAALHVLPSNVKDQVIVRWTKQRSAVQNWARRLSRWAKRMTMVRCVIQNDVAYLSETRFENARDDSEDEEEEEPFIDLDIARYSNCPEFYAEDQGQSYREDLYRSTPKYEFVDHSANSSIQHSSSWRVQNNDPAVSTTGSSIQSSSGRISPAVAPVVADDDTSGIT